MIYDTIYISQSHYKCTFNLVQRQREVFLCRYVLQHDSQLSFIMHGGVDIAVRLHKQSSRRQQLSQRHV